jgi:exosortase A-associated hydrolase 1
MNYREEPVVFGCGGDTVIGILARPDAAAPVGLVVVVGGPQYRAGSHRQFVMLARFLAARGVPVLRFDYRGMGDSTGATRDFCAIDEDIGAAVEAFFARAPGLERVVLWGLCDGASASCFHASGNAKVAGVILVNPWVRTEAGEAQTYLKHYYLRRLTDAGFWKKLLRGGIDAGASLRSLLAMAARLRSDEGRRRDCAATAHDLPDRMSQALVLSGAPLAIILSGRDFVAREFEQAARERPAWRDLLRGPRAEVVVFEAADHTFSSRERRDALALATWDWLVRAGLARDAGQALQ